jgi:flotillin
MAVIQVNDLKRAEITRAMNVVKADEDKQAMILRAEGALEAKKRESEAIAIEGNANADAEKVMLYAKAEGEKAMQMAPVEAQIVLAKEIGSNDGYQNYLVTMRKVEASQIVGIEQAKALASSDLKVIANAGDPVSGITKIMDLFSAKGGTELAAMLEAFAQSEQGQAALHKFGVGGTTGKK